MKSAQTGRHSWGRNSIQLQWSRSSELSDVKPDDRTFPHIIGLCSRFSVGTRQSRVNHWHPCGNPIGDTLPHHRTPSHASARLGVTGQVMLQARIDNLFDEEIATASAATASAPLPHRALFESARSGLSNVLVGAFARTREGRVMFAFLETSAVSPARLRTIETHSAASGTARALASISIRDFSTCWYMKLPPMHSTPRIT